MELLLLLFLYILTINHGSHSERIPISNTTDHTIVSTVKIYSNLAEIIQPLNQLPLEFSAEDWAEIRSDSLTLIGTNLTISQQTITEKKKSLNHQQIYIRSPSSSDNQIKFVRAIMIDEKQNLVKLIDPNISQDEIYLIIPSNHIIYPSKPPQLKYYVNFTYQSSDEFVRVAYLRSNLNWKTRYQLNLFEENKDPILLAMADIRNDGKSRIDIEHGELIGGDINLRIFEQHRSERYEIGEHSAKHAPANTQVLPSISKGEQIAGLYIFPIKQSFFIEGKTNYYLPMFRPRITIERYGSIHKPFFGGAGNSHGKAQRSYRITSDRFLSRGNCLIREYDRLVGEILLPDLARNNSYDFSIGQDSDLIYQENITLNSVKSYNESIEINGKYFQRTISIYTIDLLIKNFKIHSIKLEYKYEIYARATKLITINSNFVLDGSIIQSTIFLPANDEKHFSYKIEVIN